MKFKKIFVTLLTCVICIMGLLTGCTYSKLKNVNGNWEIDFSYLQGTGKSEWQNAIKTATISIDGRDVYIYVELTEECSECSLKTGKYDLDVEYTFRGISGNLVAGDRSIYFNMYDNERFEIRNISATVGGEQLYDELYFKRAGGEVKIPGNTGNPVNPTPGNSKFAKIREAYRDAGYNVELESDNSLDASSKLLISTLQTQYAALGYDICFIGKDLSNFISAEMYMLIGTKTESEALELKQGFEGAYQTAQKGCDIIVYIWTLGTPNFSYFNQAVK